MNVGTINSKLTQMENRKVLFDSFRLNKNSKQNNRNTLKQWCWLCNVSDSGKQLKYLEERNLWPKELKPLEIKTKKWTKNSSEEKQLK